MCVRNEVPLTQMANNRNFIIDHRNIYLSKKYHNLNKRLLAQKIFYKMFHLEKAKGDYTLHIKQEPKGR